jgi:hypothetical protein
MWATGYLPVQLWTNEDYLRHHRHGVRPLAVFLYICGNLTGIFPVREFN